jgi:hypothetical protein
MSLRCLASFSRRYFVTWLVTKVADERTDASLLTSSKLVGEV